MIINSNLVHSFPALTRFWQADGATVLITVEVVAVAVAAAKVEAEAVLLLVVEVVAYLEVVAGARFPRLRAAFPEWCQQDII